MPATTTDNTGTTHVYMDEPYASVRWEGKWVAVEMRGYAASAEFRAVQEMVWLAVVEQAAYRLLADIRGAKVMLVEDQRWMVENLLPRLGLAGIRFTALVTPENQLARAITTDMTKAPRSGTWPSEPFESLEDAKAWLSSKRDPGEQGTSVATR
jgi:hypothetical protein